MAKKIQDIDHSTEEKIIRSARKLFTQKGYAATRTRDIAVDAGINLALLNYYFRSKEKLFQLVMMESLEQFFGNIRTLLNREDTSLEEKIQQLANNYIDLLLEKPDLPIFMFSEIRNNPEILATRLNARETLQSSHFIQQLAGKLKDKQITVSPLHFIMNTLSLCIFPFMAAPMLKTVSGLPDEAFTTLMNERRKLIPQWIEKMYDTGTV